MISRFPERLPYLQRSLCPRIVSLPLVVVVNAVMLRSGYLIHLITHDKTLKLGTDCSAGLCGSPSEFSLEFPWNLCGFRDSLNLNVSRISVTFLMVSWMRSMHPGEPRDLRSRRGRDCSQSPESLRSCEKTNLASLKRGKERDTWRSQNRKLRKSRSWLGCS